MPKKGSSGEHNWSFAFSPRKSRPRPKLFQEDRRTLQNILVDSVKNYKFRQNETFKRIKATTLVQLILHVAEFESPGDIQPVGDSHTPFRPDTADLEVQKIQNESGGGGKHDGVGGGHCTNPPDGGHYTREEELKLIGKLDLKSAEKRPLVNSSDCPYLLLDIRDKEDFQECHIITAKNYPIARLARAFNYESKDMLQFKNMEGRIIILYDNDEVIANRAAITLVERGYENLFLLTGGLKVAYKLFPKGLTTGSIPDSLIEGAGGAKAKTAAVQPSSAREPADKPDFTQDDVDCLQMYLNNALRDNSSGSRLTQRPKGPPGRMSTLSSLSTTTNTTGAGRPPFK